MISCRQWRLMNNEIDKIIKAQDFERVSGRTPGQEDQREFIRKGIIGDWRNYISDDNKQRFKKIAGRFLIDLGYEQNNDW